MYNVKSGEQYAKITITDAETVKFSDKWDVFAVKGDDITVKLNSTDTGDGVYNTDDTGGAVIIAHGRRLDTMYLTGTGDVIVWAGASAVDCPFKSGAKGGDGGNGTHWIGTTTTAISDGSTTNPITILIEDEPVTYTAVMGDIVVYDSSEFIFDSNVWKEIGRGVDTAPTSGSANFVTSNGIYAVTPFLRGSQSTSARMGTQSEATRSNTLAIGTGAKATNISSFALGTSVVASQADMLVCGKYNSARNGDLFNIGNGSSSSNRSNIVEVNSTSMNVNGDIQQNGVSLRATTMPTITAAMLDKVVQYVGTSDANYKQGWNYVAVSDGEETPTYSWSPLMDSTPTSGSDNPVSSDGIYRFTPLARGRGVNSAIGALYGYANGNYAASFGRSSLANYDYLFVVGSYNNPTQGHYFEIGNGHDGYHRSNILEANSTSVNVNGDLQMNGINLPTPYTTMPTITESMVGQIAMYVGQTDGGFVQGWFYIASTDGQSEPTYTWVHLPTQAGYSETVLWNNTQGESTPAQYEITLSDSWTNYDAIYLFMNGADATDRGSATYLTSTIDSTNDFAVGVNSGIKSWWHFDSNTQISCTYIDSGTNVKLLKVVGISYGGSTGAVANPVRSLAKSEPGEKKEEPVEVDER